MDENQDWPFDQAPNVAAITTRQVLELKLPILLVTHYEDDHSWAFLCGTTEDYANDGRLIGMHEILHLDQSLREIADLAPGWSAWRDDPSSNWTKYPDEKASC